jgi:hypothetical protein
VSSVDWEQLHLAVVGSIGIDDYDADRQLMLLRGPAIVEGALASAIANTRITLNHSPILVVGFGAAARAAASPRSRARPGAASGQRRSRGARALGHAAIWARGLGSRAPVTVGASQWHGLRRRIEQIEASRPSRPLPIAPRVS